MHALLDRDARWMEVRHDGVSDRAGEPDMKSQNATFVGPTPAGPRGIDPPGEFIALALQSALESLGWEPGEVDNWRDGGWSLSCQRGASRLEVIVAADEPNWFLQIAPIHLPGFFGRLLGRTASATPADTYDLARHIHQVLASEGFTGFLWSWDGPPDPSSSREPTTASE